MFIPISKSFGLILVGSLVIANMSERPVLNFNNALSLIKSLEEKPNTHWLRKIHECGDEKVLRYFLKDLKRFNIENNKEYLEVLWECCQIPDF